MDDDIFEIADGDTLLLGIDLAERSEAADYVRRGRVRVNPTAGEFLCSLTLLNDPSADLRGCEFSTGSGWAVLDLTPLRVAHDAGAV